jgi:putative membrane protein
MRRIFSQIIAATAGLWLASMFVPGVIVRAYPESNFFGIALAAQWQIFLFLGVILGLLNYFIKPILKTIALPLEMVTLGLFSCLISAGLILVLDLIFDELTIPLFLPLAYTTLIVWGLGLLLQLILIKGKTR